MRKYLLTFFITLAIFLTAIGISSWINNARVQNVRNIQDALSINLLSSDMQFNLLRDANCDDLFDPATNAELGDLGERLSYMESNGKSNDPELVTLKQYYSLFEIRDYILSNTAAAKCPARPVPILYFYSADCDQCAEQGQALTYLRQHNPTAIRVYSFDYNLDVSALKTLANIHKVAAPLPALVIKGKTYNGFMSMDDIRKLIPELNVASSTTGAATSTKRK